MASLTRMTLHDPGLAVWLGPVWVLATLAISAAGQPVSRKPPADFLKEMEPLLTPLEKVMQTAGQPPADTENGWIMLDEEINHVRADGTQLMAWHQISQPRSPSGAEECGREIITYRLSADVPHLVLARSIQPDGRRQEVRPEACILQTPQREADYALYNDTGELVIIFPNVKPGTITEFLVVLEKSPRVPGHYLDYFAFQRGWRARFMRAVSEMPAEFASRVSFAPLGAGVPAPAKELLAGGRQRWTWTAENTLPARTELRGAPFPQRGPVVRATTFKDWAQFVDWYRPLVEKQMALGQKLEEEVARWTAQARSPREVLAILHERVANDVRYVGLEFGSCDIEPHPAAQVWEHQYGDCKDKASLLAAMLRFKGIAAHLVLVNTVHLGRIERRTPGPGDFNHAILVAELPDGPVFCDPTIEGSAPGVISPNDADRDVLVVSKPERWMRTPPQGEGRYAVDYDAKLSPSGEISGWASFEAEGYLKAMLRAQDEKDTRPGIIERLQGLVGEVWAGAKVVDIKPGSAKPGEPYRMQAYFVAPGDGAPVLRCPFDAGLLPDLGDGAGRRTDAFLRRGLVTSRSVITLPPELRAASVPAPLSLKGRHFEGSARWEMDGATLRASLSFDVKSSRIPAAEVKDITEPAAVLRAWLEKPVTLKAVSGAEAPATAPDGGLGDFPRMPSGEGQLDLADERYPWDGDPRLRRAALERVLQFFPKDSRTQFRARTQIAFVDLKETNPQAAIRRLRGILASQSGGVQLEDSALAEYALALALRDSKQDAEALALLDRVAANGQVSPFRRAWSHSVRSEILEGKEPARALQAALDGLALESGDIGVLLWRVCLLRARLGQGGELRADLQKFLSRELPDAPRHLRRVAASVNDLAAESPAEARMLADVLEEAGRAGAFGEDFHRPLASARLRAQAQGIFPALRERLRAWIAAHPDGVPPWKVPPALKTPDDFIPAIEKTWKRDDSPPAEIIRLDVELLTRFEPGPWYGDSLWKAAAHALWWDQTLAAKEPPPLLMLLLELCDSTPPLSEPHTHARLIRARVLSRRAQLEEAAVILRGLLAETGLEGSFHLDAVDAMAANAVARGKPEEALDAWRVAKKYSDYPSVPTKFLKAVLLGLETGNEKAAFEFLAALRGCEEAVIAKSEAAENISAFLELASDEKAMRGWWQRSAQWWPKWLDLEQQHLPKHGVAIPIVPVINNLESFGESMGSADSSGDRDAALESLRILAHAARWQPHAAVELVALAGSDVKAVDQIIRPFREVTLAIHAAGGFLTKAQADRVAVWAAVAHLDGGTPEKAIAIAKPVFEKNGTQDRDGAIMLRLWGRAAALSGKDLPAATVALEKHVASDLPPDERLRHVNVLGALYQKQNLRDKEMALLKRELENPLHKDAGDAISNLRQRYEMLLEGGGSGDGPALAVKAWLAAHKPAWFDHVRPFDLQDEQAANPDEAMAPGNDKSLGYLGAVKLCCLVAADPGQPEDRRDTAVNLLGYYSPVVATDMAQYKAWLDALKNEKSLPRSNRAHAVWLAVRKSYFSDRLTPLRHALAEPVLDHLRSDLQPELAAIRRYAKVDVGDLDAANALAAELVKGTLDYIAIESLERCIRRLAEGGQFEQARKHYKAMASARYDEDTGRRKAARQLAVLKIINSAQKLHHAHLALRDWFLASPLAKPSRSQAVPEPFHLEWDIDLPADEMLQLYRQWIAAGAWPRGDLSFWMDVADAIPRDEKQVATALSLLALALEKAPDDESRAGLIERGTRIVDTDDPPTLEALEKVIMPWRGRKDSPACQDALRLFDLKTRLRAGKSVDHFATLRAMESSRQRSSGQAVVLAALNSRGDKDGVRKLVEMIDADSLLRGGIVEEAYHAYRLLGMNDEAELALDQIRRIIDERVQDGWLMPHKFEAMGAARLAIAIGDPQAVPQPFSDHMDASLRDPSGRLAFQASCAMVRGQWEAAARVAGEGIKLFPTNYDFHQVLGLASAQLGRKDEAVRALEIFVKYEHNTRDATSAKTLLDTLRK